VQRRTRAPCRFQGQRVDRHSSRSWPARFDERVRRSTRRRRARRRRSESHAQVASPKERETRRGRGTTDAPTPCRRAEYDVSEQRGGVCLRGRRRRPLRSIDAEEMLHFSTWPRNSSPFVSREEYATSDPSDAAASFCLVTTPAPRGSRPRGWRTMLSTRVSRWGTPRRVGLIDHVVVGRAIEVHQLERNGDTEGPRRFAGTPVPERAGKAEDQRRVGAEVAPAPMRCGRPRREGSGDLPSLPPL